MLHLRHPNRGPSSSQGWQPKIQTLSPFPVPLGLPGCVAGPGREETQLLA